MNDDPVLYARFATARQHYIYDTYSNQILTVSEQFWNAVERLLATPPVDGQAAGTSEERTLLDQLAEARKAGCFHPTLIREMRFAEQEDAIIEAATTLIPQLCLEVTERCNSQCAYCTYVHDSPRQNNPRDVDWTTATNAVECFMAHSGRSAGRAISFWGGEPLVNFTLIERVIAYVSRHYPAADTRYSFTTNGSPMNPDIAHALEAHDVQLLVSLDGPPSVHDRYRRTAAGLGTCARTMSGLEVLARTAPRYYEKSVQFTCVTTPGTDLRALVAFFAEHPLLAGHRVGFTSVSGFGTNFFSQYGDYSAQEIIAIRRFYCNVIVGSDVAFEVARPTAFKQFYGCATRTRTPLGAAIHPNGCCAPLTKKMFVAVDGLIYLCERIRDNPVGDVNHGAIDRRAVLELTREYCQNSISACRRCWAVRLCGYCYRDWMKGNRWCAPNREAKCNALRQSVLSTLVDYAGILEVRPDAFTNVWYDRTTDPFSADHAVKHKSLLRNERTDHETARSGEPDRR